MTDNRLYMACLDLAAANALVVGGDAIALEKVEGLLAAHATVNVVSPVETHAGLHELAMAGVIRLSVRAYEASDLDDCLLVVVATEDIKLARRIHADARERSMLVNVADVPELCNFILPSVHRSGPLAIAVSTAGASPALGQRIRGEIAERYRESHAHLADILEQLRPWAKENVDTYEQRRDFFRSIVFSESDAIELIDRGEFEALKDFIAARQDAALGRRALAQENSTSVSGAAG